MVLEDFGRAVLGSKAVICRSLGIVQYRVSSDSGLYNTLHQQVDARARIPEDNRWDRARGSVNATLFPNHHNKIGFAMSSLNDRGLTTYGPYEIVLKEPPIMCQHRLNREPISSAYREPGFDDLIGGDAVKTLYQLLQQGS